MGEEEEGVGQAPQKVKEPKRGNKSLVLYKAEGEDEGLGGQRCPGTGAAGAGTHGDQGANQKKENYYSICVPVNPDAVTEIIANNESYISKVIKLPCAGTLFF